MGIFHSKRDTHGAYNNSKVPRDLAEFQGVLSSWYPEFLTQSFSQDSSHPTRDTKALSLSLIALEAM